MKKVIVVILIITLLSIIIFSYPRTEKIKYNPNDALVVTHQLVNKDSYGKFIKADKDYYVFSKDSEYQEFINKYFEATNDLDSVNYKNNDLVLINCKWENNNNGPAYSIDSILKKGNKIEIFIKNIGSGKIDSNDTDTAVEEFIYVELPKGTIKQKDKLVIKKK